MTARNCLALLLLLAAPAATQPLQVITPPRGERAYQIAGEVFADYWRKLTGGPAAVITSSSPFARPLPAGDLVLIGSDAVHPAVRDLLRRGVVSSLGFRYGGDGYRILSVPDQGRTLLVVAGASGRSTLYAVYDFFRRRAGVEYFWDGDVIPQPKAISLAGMDILEEPRFDYRGLRYFAHRGLHRFQAEHWDLEDWKREIDWLVKKRFNLFMLRIGIDDLFQRAFPGQVAYPPEDGRDPDAEDRSYNDRTSFWPLRYRGELRREVLHYAAERGLLHPEDTGTITHWYSHTPSSFYRSHPGFPATTDQRSGYKLPTAAIWDIDHEITWDTYWRLTETHIREYAAGPPRLFHTIGMAERLFGASDEDNLRRKLYVYRKTQQIIRERYPDVPLLLAGWDFYGWWKPEDVRRLLAEMDPRRTIVMDYTADLLERVTYREWGLYGGFPWIFGIFHSFARNSDVHEDYALLSARLGEAARDEKCIGMTLWSEISHSDTFLLEYLADNSWRPERLDPAAAVARYCRTRYPVALQPKMERVWLGFLPVSGSAHWTERARLRGLTFSEPHFRVLTSRLFLPLDERRAQQLEEEYQRLRPGLAGAPRYLEDLAAMASATWVNQMGRRDTLDIARTTASRALLAGMLAASVEMESWRAGKVDAERVRRLGGLTRRLLDCLADITGLADEFSLYASLRRLERAEPIRGLRPRINPHSEQTLKSNSENDYCRSHHYELIRHLYAAELGSYWQWVFNKLKSGDRSAWSRPPEFEQLSAQHRDTFYSTPLAQMAPTGPRGPAQLSRSLTHLSALVRELVSVP
jgi:hypothetical protein